jgi:hypothetical protein
LHPAQNGANGGTDDAKYNVTVQINYDCREQQGFDCGRVVYDTNNDANGPITFQAKNCDFGNISPRDGDLRGPNPKGGSNGAECYVFQERLPPSGSEWPLANFALTEQQDGSWYFGWIFACYWVTADGYLELDLLPSVGFEDALQVEWNHRQQNA